MQITLGDPDFTLPAGFYYQNLVCLDLANVTYANDRILPSLIARCYKLVVSCYSSCDVQALAIGRYDSVTDELCELIAQNKELAILNMEMTKGITSKGLSTLLSLES